MLSEPYFEATSGLLRVLKHGGLIIGRIWIGWRRFRQGQTKMVEGLELCGHWTD